MWDLKALATTFLEKVRWILGRTRSPRPSQAYREKKTQDPESPRPSRKEWEPLNTYYIELDANADELADGSNSGPICTEMRLVAELDLTCSTKKDQ